MPTTATKPRTAKHRRETRSQRQRESFVSSLGPNAIHIREDFNDDWDGSGLEIDEANSVIRNVKVIGNKAKNFGRDYPQRVLEAAAGKYNGKQVNINHAKPGEHVRDVNDRFGWLENVGPRQGKPGLYGDLHFNPHHERAAKVVWFAKNNPKMIGLSPDHWFREVDGMGQVIPADRAKRYNGPRSVSEILHVHSVDLVADPSTTDSLQEAYEMDTSADLGAQPSETGMDSTDHLRQHCCKMLEEALAGIDDADTLRKASAKIEAFIAKVASGKEETEAENDSESRDEPEEEEAMADAKKEQEALAASRDPAVIALRKELDAQRVREAATRKELDAMKAAEAKKKSDEAKRIKAATRCKEASTLPEFSSDFFLGELVEADEKRWDAMIADRKAIMVPRTGPASHARESVEIVGHRTGGKVAVIDKTKPLEERQKMVKDLAASILGNGRR